MLKPLHLMTPAEKAALAAELKKEAELEGDLPVFIGNPNSLFLARPARRRASNSAPGKIKKATA
jgi:hypothetical protein